MLKADVTDGGRPPPGQVRRHVRLAIDDSRSSCSRRQSCPHARMAASRHPRRAALFLASAAFTLWQNTRFAVLWDITYLLDTSYRISLGQLPYRDFPFAHAPLTFSSMPSSSASSAASTIPTYLRRTRGWSRNPPHLALPPRPAETAVRSRLVPRHAACSSAHRPGHLRRLPPPYLRQRRHPRRPARPGSLPALHIQHRRQARPGPPHRRGLRVPALLQAEHRPALPLRHPCSGSRIAIARSRQRIGIWPQLWLFTAPSSHSPPHSSPSTPPSACTTTSTGPSPSPAAPPAGLAVMLSTYRQASLLWTIPAAIAALILLRRANRWARRSPSFCSPRRSSGPSPASRSRGSSRPRRPTPFSLAPYPDPLGRARRLEPSPAETSADPHAAALYSRHPPGHHSRRVSSPSSSGDSTYALWPLLALLLAVLLVQVPTIARPDGRRHRRNLPALRRPLRHQPRAPELRLSRRPRIAARGPSPGKLRRGLKKIPFSFSLFFFPCLHIYPYYFSILISLLPSLSHHRFSLFSPSIAHIIIISLSICSSVNITAI